MWGDRLTNPTTDMELNDRIERITEMEDRYDKVTRILAALEEAIDQYEEFKSEIGILHDYMSSGQWMEDFEADEAGQIPGDLKRGVLSEDALYDLLHDADTFVSHAKELFCTEESLDDTDWHNLPPRI